MRESPIVQSLVAGTESSLVLTFNEEMPSVLKITGGAGWIKKLSAFTLEEIINKDIFTKIK